MTITIKGEVHEITTKAVEYIHELEGKVITLEKRISDAAVGDAEAVEGAVKGAVETTVVDVEKLAAAIEAGIRGATEAVATQMKEDLDGFATRLDDLVTRMESASARDAETVEKIATLIQSAPASDAKPQKEADPVGAAAETQPETAQEGAQT